MTLNFINSILASPFNKTNGENNASNWAGLPLDLPASLSLESLAPVAEKPLKMQVSVRIRPHEPADASRNKKSTCDIYTLQNSTTLLVKHLNTNEAARYSKTVKSSNEHVNRKKYTFSRIYDHETDQLDFFNEAVRPAVVDFLNNRSSTIVSYGTADAGKTYSLFGLSSSPGVIPRSIEFVYSSINCTLTPWYKPKRFYSVVNLNECDRSLEIATKEKLLSCRLIDSSACEESYEKLENSRSMSNQELFKDSMYSVWISFVEIYNDTIYDLLEVDEEGKNMQLKLAVDKSGFTYIQGMRSVCATTGLEAYEILNAGQSRLSTVWASNYKSSRSHSIFTLKLLKYNKDSSPTEVQVSSMTFYDLAGAGRIQKSVKDKKDLKESRSINTSLLALGRCFKFVAQGRPRRSTGPFRDSKLTRLFQHSLCGHESIHLLVNINPMLELYAETQNVLSFATTAMRLTSDNPRDDKKLEYLYSPLSSPKISESLSETTISPKQLEIEDLILKNQQLTTQLKELQSVKWKNEYEIRQELANFHAKQMHDLEVSWKNRMLAMEEEKENLLQFTVSKVKNFYKEKLEECTNRKRRRSDRGDFEDRFDPELFEKGDHFSKILSAKKSMESIKSENKELMAQKNKCAFELALLKQCLQKLAESVNVSCDNIKVTDLSNSMSTNDSKVSLDAGVKSHITVLQKLVVKLENLEKESEEPKKTLTQEVQCDSLCLMIIEFCKEIQNLIDQKSVHLPELNDSLDSVKQIKDENSTSDITSYLSELKGSVKENISKMEKLQAENFENLEEIANSKSVIRQLEKEILQLKDQYQESESIRSSLSKKLEDLTARSNSDELFKKHEFITVESENSHLPAIFSEQPSTLKNSSNDDSQLSLSEIESEKNESFERINDSGSSGRNDSGVMSSIDFASVAETNEKSSQTNILYDDSKNDSFEEKFLQLKLDYKYMKAQHLQESLRVSELSQEIDRIKEAMWMLKENSVLKEKVIAECKNQLSIYSGDLELARHEKQLLEAKCNELSQQLTDAQRNYEKKLIESQAMVKVREEGEEKAAKCLDDCYDKTVNLRSELSIAYSQIEKSSMRCFKEHVLRIDELEKELASLKSIEASQEEKLIQCEGDLLELHHLSDRVVEFETVFDKMLKEKEGFQNLLSEQLKIQLEIDQKITELTARIEERDDQVQSLKTEINIITRTNQMNSRKTKEFGKEINELLDDTSIMKENMKKCEETWKNLEQNSVREIGTLRDRLNAYKENTEILSSLCETKFNQQNEVEKLKTKLIDKENELEFFKQNRNATIQRYECLVRQLQNALKVNSHTSKLRKIFPYKHRYFFHGIKETSPCSIHSSEPVTSDWVPPNGNHTFSFASSLQVTHSFSENAENIEPEEDSACLLPGTGKKYLELRKKAPLNILPTQYEEPSDSSNDHEKSEPSESDRKSRKSKSQGRFFLHRRKSSKDLNQ